MNELANYIKATHIVNKRRPIGTNQGQVIEFRNSSTEPSATISASNDAESLERSLQTTDSLPGVHLSIRPPTALNNTTNDPGISDPSLSLPNNVSLTSVPISDVTSASANTSNNYGALESSLPPNDGGPRSMPLVPVTQSHDGESNSQQANSSNTKFNINLSAALLTLLLYIIPISVVVVGADHLTACPAQDMIPISYICMGCLMLVSRILSIPDNCKDIFNKRANFSLVPKRLWLMWIQLVLQFVVVCFFFAICFWIFHIRPDTEEDSPNYCKETFYENTYYGCIVGIVALVILFIVWVVSIACYRPGKED